MGSKWIAWSSGNLRILLGSWLFVLAARITADEPACRLAAVLGSVLDGFSHGKMSPFHFSLLKLGSFSHSLLLCGSFWIESPPDTE